MTFLPANALQARNLLCFLLGCLASWALHPGVWLAFGPLRWLAFMGATASVESGYEAAIAGDSGASVGMAQFNAANVRSGLITDADRRSPWRSGLATGRYVQAAIFGSAQYGIAGDWRWLPVLAIPGLGWAYLRQLWTHGPGGLRAADAGVRTVVWHALVAENERKRGLPAVLTFRGLSLGLVWAARTWVRR